MSYVLEKISLSVLALLGLFGSNLGINVTHASDEPAEMTRISLTRTSASGDVVGGTLSKNIYRYEDRTVKVPYQVPYQVEVPYTERIPYTVEVPYTERVPYTVQVPYTDYEEYNEPIQQCGYVPIQDCRSVPRCRMERQCSSVPGACRNVSDQVCRRGPDGRQTCTPVNRRHCDPPRQVCQDRQVCHNDRVCSIRNEYRCRTEYVRRTRPVTRYRTETHYRDEQRTRTETRYREEQRTRTETRHRTEYRDEIRPVPVYVRQWSVPVRLQFPVEARLMEGEQELIQVSLVGEESSPSVQVSIDSRHLNYRVLNQERSDDGNIVVRIALVPRYSSAELGSSNTIQKLRMEVQKDSHSVSVRFMDSARHPRIQNQYQIQIRDLDLGRIVFETEQTRGTGLDEIFIPVSEKLSLDHDFTVELRVVREGVVIEGGRAKALASVAVNSVVDYSRKADPSQVRNLQVRGNLSDLLIQFEDHAADHAKVDTRYRVIVKRPKKFLFIRTGWEVIGQAIVNKTEIRPGDLGMSADVIADYLEPGDRVVVELQTTRTSERFPGRRPIVLPVQEVDTRLN